MTNPLVTAIPTTGTGSAANVRAGLALALALPLADADAVAEFHTYDLAADGTLYPAVIYNGTVFEFDPDDTISGHDPDGGCITDASGRRYKNAGALKPDHFVLDKDLTAPPGTPDQGDAYVIATAATGAWAGHDGEIAYYGRQGWQFRTIAEGEIVYVSDESAYYSMPASGTLSLGLGNLAIGAGSIAAKQLRDPFGFRVQAQQNTPPGSLPAAGTSYIVGEVPTGAWVGKANQIAESNGSGWDYFVPVEGNQVYDIAAKLFKVFSSGAWSATSSTYVEAIPVVIDHVYNMTVPDDTEQIVKAFTFTLQPDDVVFFRILQFELTLKKASGANNNRNSGEVFFRLDGSATNFVEFNTQSTLVSSFSFSSSEATVPVDVMDVVQDSSEHSYNIGFLANYDTNPVVDAIRLRFKAMIFIYRNTIVES